MSLSSSLVRSCAALLVGALLVAAAQARAVPPAPAWATAIETLAASHPPPARGDGRAQLFLLNVKRFLARYYVPPGGLTLPDAVGRALTDHVQRAFDGLEVALPKTSRSDPRAVEAALLAALARQLPREIDARGDVLFLPDAPPERRLHIASEDLALVRDFGLSARLLHAALRTGALKPTADPGASAAGPMAREADLYVAAVIRMAGRVAREEQAHFLHRGAFDAAAAEIREPGTATAVAAAPAAGRFRDVGRSLGIDFEHRSAAWLERFRRSVRNAPPSFGGSGLAAEDLNGDGWDDLVLLSGDGGAVYWNRSGVRFEAQPLPPHPAPGRDSAEPRQPLVADFDDDGRPDILIVYLHAPHRLLVADASGAYRDAEASGLGGAGLHEVAATVADLDGDGDLDVYLCGFGALFRGFDPSAAVVPAKPPGAMPKREADDTNGTTNRLLRNLGGLRFEEAALPGAGETRWCRSVNHTDFDGDGRQDLLVANDFGRNTLLRNAGGRFEDVSLEGGLATIDATKSFGLGDLDGDSRIDLYAANPNRVRAPEERGGEPEIVSQSRVYLGRREMGFAEADRIAPGNAAAWAWDGTFFDFDNDGDEDLYVSNGSQEVFRELVEREVGGKTLLDWSDTPNLLYENDGDRFVPLEDRDAGFRGNARASVALDFDRDGDLDLAVAPYHGRARLLRNEGRSRGGFLRLDLVGDAESGSSRDAIGAQVELSGPDGLRARQEVRGSSGYRSDAPDALHFATGTAKRVDVSIRWPSGLLQRIEGLATNRSWRIAEGHSPEPERPRR